MFQQAIELKINTNDRILCQGTYLNEIGQELLFTNFVKQN